VNSTETKYEQNGNKARAGVETDRAHFVNKTQTIRQRRIEKPADETTWERWKKSMGTEGRGEAQSSLHGPPPRFSALQTF